MAAIRGWVLGDTSGCKGDSTWGLVGFDGISSFLFWFFCVAATGLLCSCNLTGSSHAGIGSGDVYSVWHWCFPSVVNLHEKPGYQSTGQEIEKTAGFYVPHQKRSEWLCADRSEGESTWFSIWRNMLSFKGILWEFHWGGLESTCWGEIGWLLHISWMTSLSGWWLFFINTVTSSMGMFLILTVSFLGRQWNDPGHGIFLDHLHFSFNVGHQWSLLFPLHSSVCSWWWWQQNNLWWLQGGLLLATAQYTWGKAPWTEWVLFSVQRRRWHAVWVFLWLWGIINLCSEFLNIMKFVGPFSLVLFTLASSISSWYQTKVFPITCCIRTLLAEDARSWSWLR